jgi:hypothetical protein
MKLVHSIIVAAFFGTACSGQNDSASVVNDAETNVSSANVKHDRPQKVDLVRYDISHGSTAPMKIKVDISEEESCFESANWRLKKLDNGDHYVTVEMLAHPAIPCLPSMIKKHQLGIEIDLPVATTSDQVARVWVQRLEHISFKRSVEAISEKETRSHYSRRSNRSTISFHFNFLTERLYSICGLQTRQRLLSVPFLCF